MTTIYNTYRCWASDWSKSIIIEADKASDIRRFKDQIKKLVGKNFRFELSLKSEKPQYFIDNKNGLISY